MRHLGPDAVKAFISQVLPWDGAGFVQLHWCHRVEGKLQWSGHVARDVDDFIYTANAAASSGRDIYYCTSLQKEQRTAFVHGPPIRSKRNAIALKAIYADLDVKEKAYTHLGAAIRAAEEFCKKVGVPHPNAWIGSGNGLHIYWILSKPLSLEEWNPYAKGLKACLQEYGVIADYGCTSNACQLLRVPGTFNHKTNPPKPVELIIYND
jgi:hypothetical protein